MSYHGELSDLEYLILSRYDYKEVYYSRTLIVLFLLKIEYA